MTTLDPQAKPVLDAMIAGANKPVIADDAAWVAGLRANYRAMIPMAGPPLPVAEVIGLDVPGPRGVIPCRLYRPAGAADRPVMIYFHGGGFVVGDLETHDPLCRAIAHESGSVVLAVGYRLAPEHPFPAGLDDCRAATAWAASNAGTIGGDVRRLVVAGDSAGGTLAAVVARDRGLPIVLQVLIYPNVDFAAARDYPSYHGPYVTPHWRERMDRYMPLYLPPGTDPGHPDVSPLAASDLAGLPPALVLTAGADPLCDEAVLYAQKLMAAGVRVAYWPFPGQIHGFLQMGSVIDAAKAAITVIAASLKAA